MPRGKEEQAEQIIPKLREVEVEVGRGKTVVEAIDAWIGNSAGLRRKHYPFRAGGGLGGCHRRRRSSGANSGSIRSRQRFMKPAKNS